MMLRHIFSLSLAMTACATFMPTKVNAATLTVLPAGDQIVRRISDLVEFTFELTPAPNSTVRITGWNYGFDTTELTLISGAVGYLVTEDTLITTKTPIFSQLFLLLDTPLKDGIKDAYLGVKYDEQGPSGNFTGLFVNVDAGDVVPPQSVPEPLTIFGTAIGLGCGVLFKRKSSKKTVS
jgi:PEP-CTERM putative exosortase interaction domain